MKIENIEVTNEEVAEEPEFEEELENIIEETPSAPFPEFRHSLEEISPSLKPTEAPSLEQGVENIQVESVQESDEKAVIYEQPTIYEESTSAGASYGLDTDYLSAATNKSYDTSIPTPDGSSGKMITDIQPRQGVDRFTQTQPAMGQTMEERQQGTQKFNRQYETKSEKDIKERRRQF